MAVPFSNTKLRVPKGFQNILEGLAREVLRAQPDNIFEFGSSYFQQLLKVREETGHDPAVHGARLEDRFYNNDSFKSPDIDASSKEQQDAALKIQTNYRKHAAEQEVAAMREEDAAEKIQAGLRGYQDRQKYQDMKSPGKDEEEVDIDLNDPDVEQAALKIQAGFKGFKARQEIKELKEQKGSPTPPPPQTPKTDDEGVDIDLDDPEVAEAALKIQAGFRGHQSRQEYKKIKEQQTAQKDQTKEEPIKDQDEIDLDLDDPELKDAALRIQTGFRGHLARKEVKAMKEEREAKEKEETKKEEEVDIDLEDPEVQGAALKIQAGFKGMKARQEVKALKEAKETEPKETKEEKQEEDVDIDLNDPQTEQAAIKIQAGFKGYKTRKEMKEKKEAGSGEGEKTEQETDEKKEEVDIDLNDPEVEKAATKIQAGFKGYKTRKEMKESKDSKEAGTDIQKEEEGQQEEEKQEKTEGEEVDIDLNDPEVEKAATKIQAGFKGYKTRQEIAQKKAEQGEQEKKDES